MKLSRDKVILLISLFSLYFIWGSTYFLIKIGLESFPPVMLTGLRFITAGLILTIVLLFKRAPRPPKSEIRNAALVGIMLLAAGNGSVTLAEHFQVPSGLTAVMVATVPLFTLSVGFFYGHKAARIEWAGVALGLFGIIILNSGGHLGNNPWGSIIILFGSLCWAIGTNWGASKPLPEGLMAGAIEMVTAGLVLLIISQCLGERVQGQPTIKSLSAMAYLIIFGSVVTIVAYMYLIRHTSQALATSYAYVNPLVAVFIGTMFGHESLKFNEFCGLIVIITAVLLVTAGKRWVSGAENKGGN
ncbi:TPA: drug/metabolite exporter YedA [Serratia marcescens]